MVNISTSHALRTKLSHHQLPHHHHYYHHNYHTEGLGSASLCVCVCVWGGGLWWSQLLRRALRFIAASNYSPIVAYIYDIKGRYMRPQYQGTRFHPTRKIRNNNGALSPTLRNGSLSFTLSSRSRIHDVWARPVTQDCVYNAFSEPI